MSPAGAALQPCLIVMEVAVYILPAGIDWQGFGDFQVVQRGLRGLEVARSVKLVVFVYVRLQVT